MFLYKERFNEKFRLDVWPSKSVSNGWDIYRLYQTRSKDGQNAIKEGSGALCQSEELLYSGYHILGKPLVICWLCRLRMPKGRADMPDKWNKTQAGWSKKFCTCIDAQSKEMNHDILLETRFKLQKNHHYLILVNKTYTTLRKI